MRSPTVEDERARMHLFDSAHLPRGFPSRGLAPRAAGGPRLTSPGCPLQPERPLELHEHLLLLAGDGPESHHAACGLGDVPRASDDLAL